MHFAFNLCGVKINIHEYILLKYVRVWKKSLIANDKTTNNVAQKWINCEKSTPRKLPLAFLEYLIHG